MGVTMLGCDEAVDAAEKGIKRAAACSDDADDLVTTTAPPSTCRRRTGASSTSPSRSSCSSRCGSLDAAMAAEGAGAETPLWPRALLDAVAPPVAAAVAPAAAAAAEAAAAVAAAAPAVLVAAPAGSSSDEEQVKGPTASGQGPLQASASAWLPPPGAHLATEVQERLLPRSCQPCPVRLRGTGLGRNGAFQEVPCGQSRDFQSGATTRWVLNAGSVVTSIAWGPPHTNIEGEALLLLVLGVNSRVCPVTRRGQGTCATAAVQFWRFDGSDAGARLCLGLVHQGASARELQWLPGGRAPQRLGLLLMVLGSGALELHAVPEAPFRRCHHGASADAGGAAGGDIFWRLPPAWAAPTSMPGVVSRHSTWRFCSAACRPATESGECLIAGGSDHSIVRLWQVVVAELASAKAHSQAPFALLQYSPDAGTVWSLAWAPERHECQLLAAGVDGGYVLLWDCRQPTAPLSILAMPFREAVFGLEWHMSMELLVRQADGSVYSFADQQFQLVRRRRQLAEGTLTGVECSAVTSVRGRILSAWSDGAVWVAKRLHRGVARKNHPTWARHALWHLKAHPKRRVRSGASAAVKTGRLTRHRFRLKSKSTSKDEVAVADGSLQRAFFRHQAAAVRGLRTWEDGPRSSTPLDSAASARRGVIIELADEPRKLPRCRGGTPDQASSKGPCVPLPITALAVSCGSQRKKQKVRDVCFVAAGSAAGLVHVWQWPS